jgi:hypothetical protein
MYVVVVDVQVNLPNNTEDINNNMAESNQQSQQDLGSPEKEK